MVLLFNPIIGMLHNTGSNRYHPILFSEHPLPGPPTPDKPIRLKSKGHHTKGFDTRQEAIQDAETNGPKDCEGLKFDWSKDILWDGTDIPAMVAFLIEEGGKPNIVIF